MFIELTTEVGQSEYRMLMIRAKDIKSVTELSEIYTPRCEILTYSNEVYRVKESYSDVKKM